jgi:signal transduction histidine kinase
MIRLLVFFIFSISLQFGNAQVILEHLTKKDGLPSNYISGIIQDNEGFIWIATPNGALRYDGKTMKTYTVEDGLTTNEIVGFFKDGIGRIWFNCFGGKASYYYKGKIFNNKTDKRIPDVIQNLNVMNISDSSFVVISSRYFHNSVIHYRYLIDVIELKMLSFDSITISYNESGHRDIYFRTIGKLDLSNSGLSFKAFYYIGDRFIGFKSIRDSILLYHIDNSDQIKKIKSPPENFKIVVLKDKNVYFYNTKEIICIDTKDTISLSNSIRGIYMDKDNLLWVSTDNGFFKIQLKRKDEYLIKSPIYCLKKIENDLFIGLNDLRYSKYNSNKVYTGAKINKDYGNNRVLDFVKIGKEVFKGTDLGIIKLNNQTNEEWLPIGHINVKNITGNKSNLFYAAMGFVGILKINFNGKVIISSNIYGRRTYCVFQRQNGQLLASTIDGLLIWENDTLPHQRITLPFSNIEMVNHINEDRNQNLIFSSNNGLILKSNRNYFLINKVKGLFDNHINKTFTSADGKRLYVCTNKGFNIVDYSIKDKKLLYNIKSYNISDGLPSDEVNCALEEGDKVYVGTMEGLFILPVKDTIKPFKIPLRLEGLLVNDSTLELKNKEWNHNQNTFQFNFSAFYYQRNKEMQFAYQLTPIDKNPIISDNPSIIYRGLAPGEYKLKVYAFDKHYPRLRKSQIWNYNFTISPPYYKTWWFISLMTLLVVSGGFLIYINYMQRKQKQNLEVQTLLKQMAQHRLEALKGQMNPHFIFNSLNTVQHFISTHNEREAMDFIAKFSSLIRKMLDLARVDKLSLKKEIQFLKDYGEIEQIRYAQKFDVDFIVDVSEHDDIELPSMLVQPLLENAIKHGVSNLKERRGRIEVVIMTEVENWLIIKIKDNGNGLVKRDESSKVHTSAALDIIRERLTVYEVDGRKGKLDIQFSENGTVSELVVPI